MKIVVKVKNAWGRGPLGDALLSFLGVSERKLL